MQAAAQQWRRESPSVERYLASIHAMNPATAKGYRTHLNSFQQFVYAKYDGKDIETLLKQLRAKKADPYNVLGDFLMYLQKEATLSVKALKGRVTIVKNFIEYSDVDISNTKFKLKVRLPKSVSTHKEAIDKSDIHSIIEACQDLRLKTYVLFLAATGMRAKEALSIRVKDLNLNSDPATVYVRAAFTKTRKERTVYLTSELRNQLVVWLDYKYRKRRIVYGPGVEKRIVPERNPDDLIFAVFKQEASTDTENVYNHLVRKFQDTLRLIKREQWEDSKKRRTITFHSFRRFVKSTISDLGHQDYSEWFIGHSESTYYRKKESERVEIFKKIEGYISYIDITALEAKGADQESKIEQLEARVAELTQVNQRRGEMLNTEEDFNEKLLRQYYELSARLAELERSRMPVGEEVDELVSRHAAPLTAELKVKLEQAAEDREIRRKKQ